MTCLIQTGHHTSRVLENRDDTLWERNTGRLTGYTQESYHLFYYLLLFFYYLHNIFNTNTSGKRSEKDDNLWCLMQQVGPLPRSISVQELL